ncbi:alkaline phosphatase [Nakamurella flava]|uniref:Alkaline phosphatase n=1 Tax=Nakamurella flava TaxID=2576308 RepID=A0A4U6QKV4_9ACTN|nr:alkaline phosphatase [Nakamurella flava]TKV61103.1 alkaline phosphatase [Nakamurella flava]
MNATPHWRAPHDDHHRPRRRGRLLAPLGVLGLAVATAAVGPLTTSWSTAAAPTAGTATVAPQAGGDRNPHGARNVIFIQGDGMGIAHRELIRLATQGQDGDLRMNRMDRTGFVHTDSADTEEAVTDSAAAATAYATGVRSYNGAVGVDVDGNPLPTLLEEARDRGRATGLVTTSQVTDATPAAFSAHVADRGDQSEIARQIIEQTQVDLVLGGGEDWWYPEGDAGAWPDNPPKDPTEQSKGTEGNLVDRAQQLGYQYVSTGDELAGIEQTPVLGLFANEEMFEHHNEGEGDLYEPAVPLPDMAAKAMDLLSTDPDGFFLLIEEEGIDEMSHHGNAHLTVTAGQALDETVGLALDFAARTPGTLVLVVGDHETGGLAIENVDPDDENAPGEQAEDEIPIANSDLVMSVDWTTNGHTGAATPITASGPGAADLGRVLRNTEVHDAVRRAMLRACP